MGFAADRAREDYSEGYREGYADGIAYATRNMQSEMRRAVKGGSARAQLYGNKKPKRRKSKKVKILDEMAKKQWNKYKKGSGKKTYIQIRAQVSRSQAYKKKVKNL